MTRENIATVADIFTDVTSGFNVWTNDVDGEVTTTVAVEGDVECVDVDVGVGVDKSDVKVEDLYGRWFTTIPRRR